MAITRVTLPTVESLRNRYCDDVRRLKIRAGVVAPNVAAGSETAIKGEAVASATFQIMSEVAATQDSNMPDKAVWNSQLEDLPRLALVWKGITPSLGGGATGNLVADCTGIVAYPAGAEWKTDDGLRYEVVTTVAVTTGMPIPVAGVDVGTRTDKSVGVSGTWTSPPAGSNTTALVGPGGLTNGTEPDNESRLRLRFQDALRHPAESGSWAHYAEWAETNASVEKAFVYPAPQGPATVHVAYTVAADVDNLTGAYTREGTAVLTNLIGTKIVQEDPEHADVLTTTVVDEGVNLSLRVELPAHPTDGGPGGSWKDAVADMWPLYHATSPYATHLDAAPSSPTILRVDVLNAANAPVDDAFFAVWSSIKKKFIHARVYSSAVVAGTVYDVTLYSAIDTSVLSSGDWLSPDSYGLDDYGATIAEQFAGLGPGEKTSNALLLPRSLRHPLPTESWPSKFTSVNLGKLSVAHPEVSHCAVAYYNVGGGGYSAILPASPTVCAAVTDPPNILVLGNLAIYKI
jgi:hypothetical protein